MKYDSRIKDYHDIRCFASRNNRECLGEYGYFAEDISEFENLDKCAMGICYFKDGEEFPFYRFDHTTRSLEYPKKAYPLFCPVSAIKEEKKEKKYRPYTIDEFCNEGFEIVVFRDKDDPSLEYHVRYNGYRKCDNVYKVILGNISYLLDDLFEDFEYLDSDGEWKPFGVEDEQSQN